MSHRYAELHCRSSFSFLAGASHPRELVLAAGVLGLEALAITDVSGVYGVVRAWEARRKQLAAHERGELDERTGEPTPRPPRLIYGAELALDPLPSAGGELQPSDALVVLVRDAVGWSKLTQAITRGRRRVDKGEFALTQRELRRQGGEHWCVLAGGARSRLSRLLRQGEEQAARRELDALREAFGDALALEPTRHARPGDLERSLALASLGAQAEVPLAATNDVLFHAAHRKKLHDVLTCIRLGVPLGEAGRRLLPNAERRLKGHAAMAALFSDLPTAVDYAGELAARCTFALDELTYSYPEEAVPPGESADEYLGRLARRGLVARLGTRRAAELRERLERELSIIAELRYAGYFLTMWEVVRFCRREAILCQGRGSAANSLVCYATGITSVSPDQIDMLFERFVSLERKEPPDIDLDIEHDRREEVLQHVYETYGREKAAMVCSVITYRHRSAIRDVGKVLGFDEQTLARVTRYIASGMGSHAAPPGESHDEESQQEPGQTSATEQRATMVRDEAAIAAGLDPRARSWRQLLLLSELLVDFPRHLSIHTGGFLLCKDAVAKLVPVENGRMVDRTVIQWDKDDIDALGLFKVDLLGLGMLNVIARAFRFVEEHHGLELDLGSIPPDDPGTYAMIQAADTIGVFQIESRAQMNMLPRLKPRDFYDLVIEVALVRPGPIQGGMVHPFLRRRRGEEPADVPHPALEPILGRTLGVPIFQEQVMRIAVAVGGYTPGEADQLRRDMAAWRRAGNMGRHQQRLREAMAARGIEPSFADRIIQQIEGFGSYGFPESHAAAFAHLVYISAYLKRHFPAEFAAALIDAQPMGFYQISTLVADAHRHEVPIEGVDVQHSVWTSTVLDRPESPNGLRLGLKLVRGLREVDGRRVVAERVARGAYGSVSELARRCQLDRKGLDALALAGAFRSLTTGRREAVWQASALGGHDLVANLDGGDGDVRFAALSEADELRLDYAHAQSFIEHHPLRLYRERLRRSGVLRSVDLLRARPGSLVKVAGLVIVRQRPGGGKMIFMALEDETGLVDLAVNLEIFARYRPVIMLAEVLYAEGTLQLDGRARSVLARSFRNISGRVGGVRSRDFH
jgi:error-prone DNA polymerase